MGAPVVLAQTASRTTDAPTATSSSATATGSPSTATTHSTNSGMTTSPTASSTSRAPTYYTADHQMRLSKIVGASVYNDQNQSIGSIDDVLMTSSDKAGTAVLSVGGFLGMGAKLVSVPFDQLKVQDNKIVMPGATKASLEGMPDYHYSNA